MFCDLLENINKANDKVLKRVNIIGNDIRKRAKRSAHYTRIVIEQPLTEIRKQMRNGGRRFEVEAVQRHNGLLPNGVLGVVKKLDDTRKHGGDGLLVDEPADGVKSGANDEVVIGGEVFLDCVDDEDDEVVVVAEEEREGEVAGALQEEGVVVSHLDGVDVSEGGVVAEHLDIEEADDVLLDLAFRSVGVVDAAF